jgi:hypothetical protein
MNRLSTFAKFERNKVRIGNYTYTSTTLDDYPPLDNDYASYLKSFSDIDTIDGLSQEYDGHCRDIYRSPCVAYDFVTQQQEKEIVPRHEAIACHYFTLHELTSAGNIRVEAFKPTFVFETGYQHREDVVYQLEWPHSDHIVGDLPNQIEYVLPYGVRNIDDVVELIGYGEIYNCPEATAKYPDSCIWRVPFGRRYFINEDYPEIIKLLKRHHFGRRAVDRTEQAARVIDLSEDDESDFEDINKFLSTDWAQISECTHKVVLAKQYLKTLSPRTIAYLLPTLQRYVHQATLDLAVVQASIESTQSTLTDSINYITTKRARIGDYQTDSSGTKESPYYLEDSDEDTKPRSVPVKYEYEESEIDTDTEM